MKKNVKKHTNGVWYYAVVRWDGYGVFTSWDRAREECDGYSDNKKKKFKTFEEGKHMRKMNIESYTVLRVHVM